MQKKKRQKIDKTNRLSKIEEERIRASVDDLMKKYVSKDTNPINDIRNYKNNKKEYFMTINLIMK